MALHVREPEIFGVTEESVTVAFRVEDEAGPVDAPAVVRVGERCVTSHGAQGVHHVRVSGLDPDRTVRVAVELEGGTRAEPDAHFPGQVRTLPAPRSAPRASFATLNDLHFGEPRFGGVLDDDYESGEERPGFPVARAEDTEVPYWRFMNEDAVAEINAAGVDAAVIKGDIADRGLPEQFAEAARTFAGLEAPHHAILGNHDYYARNQGEVVDGYALLDQPPAPRRLELSGWRLLLLETAEPGEHHGVFGAERRAWLQAELEAGREERRPTLLVMHHQPVPPEHRESYPNSIGLRPEDSVRLFEMLGAHPQVHGVLIGHTHRNRVRRYAACPHVPFVEVNCTKDYPGGWAHYRLYEDGSFRQEVRRTATPRALAHSGRCAGFFRGYYRRFALGRLEERSFVAGAGHGA